jgi:hypothetical protein
MAWTQADIDALKSALGRGLKRARINGEEVEYASIAEMKSVLSMMESEVAGTSRATVSVVYPYTTRGL